MKLYKQLWIPDAHVPNEDRRAFRLIDAVAKGERFDELIIGGDFGDFDCLSDHGNRDPKREQLLRREVAPVRAAIAHAAECWVKPKGRKVFVEGNHEWRLDRYIANYAAQLEGLVTVESLLGLDDWEFVEYKSHTRIGKVYTTHDTGKAGAQAHLQACNDFQDNTVINHTHRLGYAVVGNAKGQPHVAAMFGWLGDARKVDYMHRIKAKRDWALGFGVGYRRADGVTYLQPVPIVGYTCVVGGRFYEA